ncbi:hypothetical protein DFH06DRAFT_1332623 [Mycena polygramma]|nr:hypothetical protein DFH06DRAFT_1332623 [Mycena polygramma]
MRIPQELIDEILDEFDLSEKYDDRIAQTLKSCALVARSFVRASQTRLFARISVHDHEANHPEELKLLPYSPHSASTMLCGRLSALLSSSPHIATYIQTLDLFYNGTEPVPPMILAAVTELRALTLTDHFCGYFPVNPNTLAVFSLRSLRCVELGSYSFHDPCQWELESLLSTATSLRELTLRAVEFSDCNDEDDEFAAGKKLTGTGDGGVILETLTLIRMEAFAVRPIVNLFNRVDVKHLTSLSLLESPVMGFLKANARSIETLTIGKAFSTRESFRSVSAVRRCFNTSADWLADVPDPALMAGENRLTSVHFDVNEIDHVVTHLPLLGDLRNLKVLKTIRISLHRSLRESLSSEDPQQWEEWTKLDTLLLPLPSGVEVDIYAAFDSELKRMEAPDVDVVKKCLPLLSDRGTLRVYWNPSCEVGQLF